MIKDNTFKNLEECKEYVKEKLKETDYVTLIDVKDKISNYDDFIKYRNTLRQYLFNPAFNFTIDEPDPIWINS
jgi:hypothetical protein